MSIKYPELFEPFHIGKVEIKNRVVLTSMAINGRLDKDGNVTDESINYYVDRARGGCGLIITHSYTPLAGIETNTLSNSPFHNPGYFITQGQKLVEQCHAYGAKVFFDVFLGMGRQIFPGAMTGSPVSASAVPNRWDPAMICKELTKEQIQNNISATVQAVVLCKMAGADGICFDGAYGGYLADQFCIDAFNKRTDEFGGSIENKMRMATEIIKGIKQQCGSNFPVLVRLSAKHHIKGMGQGTIDGEEYVEYGRDIEESIEIAKKFEACGADGFLMASGNYDSMYWLYPPMYQKEGLWIDDVAPITAAVNIPVICPGRINQPHMANSAIKEGKIDAVAIGRQLLADPEWANKAHADKDEEIRPCIGCNNGCVGKVFSGQTITCAVNPTAFRTLGQEMSMASQSKKVAVIGGGVAGMEAARIAAIRGHRVTLFEKSNELGGALIPASVPKIKDEDRRLLKWYKNQLVKEGVDVQLNTEVTLEMLQQSDADDIVVATGSKEKVPPIKGVDNANVITAITALSNPAAIGEKVVVIGGGQVGCEVALWLKEEYQKDVVILEAMPAILGNAEVMPLTTTLMLPDLLAYHHVEVKCNVNIRAIMEKAVEIAVADKNETYPCDTVILATGYRADDSLYRKIVSNIDKNIWRIGDADHPSNIMNAVRDGNAVAREI